MSTKLLNAIGSQQRAKRLFQGIFGTDGIRALAGEEPLTPESVRRIGFSAGTVLARKFSAGKSAVPGAKKIVIGRDTRASGNWILDALGEGLWVSGCEVYSCGVIPTSAISAILLKKKFMGGAVISASHNPAEFNGIKFFTADGNKIQVSWEKEIESELIKNSQKFSSYQDRLTSKHDNGLKKSPLHEYKEGVETYTQFLKAALPRGASLRGVKLVIDCANGAAAQIAPQLFRSLGAEVTPIFDHPDGSNINLKCGALYPESLRKAVLSAKANGGFAFDGDADRVQFVDELGEVLDGDILLYLAAAHLKDKKQLDQNTVVTTVMANYGFFNHMKSLGINVITTPVGDRAVSAALEKSKALLGGEQSGHIIFKNYLPTGDGLLTAIKILFALKESGNSLAQVRKSFKKLPQILVNLRVKQKIPLQNLPKFAEKIKNADKELKGKGRVLVRYSGTEPLLRIMAEGEPQELIQKVVNDLLSCGQECLEVLPLINKK